ncbi:MAG: hypothetical protein J6D47_11990 [Peptostreptococcaceae bacterium]|nr:hypothetical protein [Peptostreptococcaceae bacterium]
MDFDIKLYEAMCVQAIRMYLNRNLSDEYILTNFNVAIERMAYKLIQKDNSKKPTGVKSITEGDVAITFETESNNLIDDEIKLLLPLPCISMY